MAHTDTLFGLVLWKDLAYLMLLRKNISLFEKSLRIKSIYTSWCGASILAQLIYWSDIFGVVPKAVQICFYKHFFAILGVTLGLTFYLA